MKLYYSERFRQNYASASPQIRRAFDKQAALLVKNLRHPSLRAKKYDEKQGIWQARVTKGWRFYFTVEGDTYILRNIIPHSK